MIIPENDTSAPYMCSYRSARVIGGHGDGVAPHGLGVSRQSMTSRILLPCRLTDAAWGSRGWCACSAVCVGLDTTRVRVRRCRQ